MNIDKTILVTDPERVPEYLALVTGLTLDEVTARISVLYRSGMTNRQALQYFARLAQARGNFIAIVDDKGAN